MMNGLHILAEWYDCRCSPALLSELSPLQTLCREACQQAGLTIVTEAFHVFGKHDDHENRETNEINKPHGQTAGVTGAFVLAESHLAIHTWPETASVTLDLYVCNFSRDNRLAAEQAFSQIQKHFQPGHSVRHDVERGKRQNSRFDEIIKT